MTILLYILVGLGVGIVGGTLGIGGGILLVPILMWVFGFSQPKAIGTTLGVLIPPIGLMAAIRYYQQDLMDVHAAVWIAISFAIGAYIGASLVPILPKELLRILFGLMLLYIGTRFLLHSEREVINAAAGCAAVALGWAAYFGLRAIGRRYSPPSLRQEFRRFQHESYREPDYYI